eukprot:3595463-Rhodomonas_salina.1
MLVLLETDAGAVGKRHATRSCQPSSCGWETDMGQTVPAAMRVGSKHETDHAYALGFEIDTCQNEGTH